jgi:single-stranded-DNA-specific exonuclease
VDAAFYPQVNEFRGLRSVQLLITDLRRSLSPTQKDLLLYHRYHTGQLLEREELLRLVPERENFIAVWRYLARPGGTGMVTEAPTTLARNISNAVGRPQLCSTTMVCLEVFHERGLIDLQVNTRQVQIALHRPSQKVDLEASEIMRQLRRMIDDYED